MCPSRKKLRLGSHSPSLCICAQWLRLRAILPICLEVLNPRNGRDWVHCTEYLIFIGQLSNNSPTCIFLLLPRTPFAMHNFQFGTRYYELHQYLWHNSVMCYLPRVVVFKLKQASESPGGWIKTQAAELHPESFWFRGFGVGPRMCMSNTFPLMQLVLKMTDLELYLLRNFLPIRFKWFVFYHYLNELIRTLYLQMSLAF